MFWLHLAKINWVKIGKRGFGYSLIEEYPTPQKKLPSDNEHVWCAAR